MYSLCKEIHCQTVSNWRNEITAIRNHLKHRWNHREKNIWIMINLILCMRSFDVKINFMRNNNKSFFLILSPFYSLCLLIPSQYFSTVSLHFSTIFKYCECIFPWNYFSVKKNPIFFTETSECIFPWNYFSNFISQNLN
jgi:hypothetical protein